MISEGVGNLVKQYIALMLAGLMLVITVTACSSGEAGENIPEETTATETVPMETEAETEAPETEEETEPAHKQERPEEVEVIDYIPLELEKDAVYDRAAGIFVMYFTDHELLYPEDSQCSVGLISGEEAFSIAGTPDFTAYPDVKVDDDDYCGIAIRIAEEIPAGEYRASVTFDRYIVTFDFIAK